VRQGKSFSIVNRHGLDNRSLIPGKSNEGIFSHRHFVQTGSRVHAASCVCIMRNELEIGDPTEGKRAVMRRGVEEKIVLKWNLF